MKLTGAPMILGIKQRTIALELERRPVRRECGQIDFEYLGGRLISGRT